MEGARGRGRSRIDLGTVCERLYMIAASWFASRSGLFFQDMLEGLRRLGQTSKSLQLSVEKWTFSKCK